MLRDPQQVLQDVYGFDSFISPQRQIIDRIMAGQDALVIMPTGGGKSLCYQVPSVCMEGLGVIVSPLIALMEDQVQALKQNGVRAAFLNSTVPPEQSRQIRNQLFNGGLDLLYVAPERLLMEHFLGMLGRLDIALFAIDEAHCVSEWGPNFRPDYHRLKVLHERFPQVPRIALTATADPHTRRDMLHQLRMQDADVTITTFDRPNIHFRVEPKSRAKEKLVDFITSEHDGEAGIVYCMTRKSTEQTAEYLSRKSINALPYHAGMSDAMRPAHQQDFLQKDDVVIAATIAFGMGIDKPDVRFVAHLDMPKTLEEYHQQTGRAGRDGQPADAWMAYSSNDRWRLLRLIESDDPDPKFLKVQKNKLDAMVEFCETKSCRRHFLLKYFGEDSPARCGNCDNCGDAPGETEETKQAETRGDPSGVTLKALRCVKETGQCRGPAYMAKVLHGSEADSIVQNGDHDISVHGAGLELTVPQWRKMFRKLIADGYLESDAEFGGTITLTDKGWQAIAQASAEASPVQNEQISAESRDIPPAPPADNELYEALRKKRLELARAQNLPAYCICDNKTLEAIAARKPQTEEELRACPGIGPVRLRKYGEDFLEVVDQNELK